jgi:Uma2 family endonuclease
MESWSAAAAGRKLTYDDFVHFPDDGLRHELIDGVHYVTPAPLIVHERVVTRLLVALVNHLDACQAGEAFGSRVDVVLSLYDVVEPDLLVVLSDQQQILTEENVRGAPAIVVEVLSRSTSGRDRDIKRALYDRAGVREYWMVDPVRATVVQCVRNEAGALVSRAPLRRSARATLTSDLLPGFALTLEKLFA